MLKEGIKHALKVIFVIIVIIGLLASYIFMGTPAPAPEPTAQPGAQYYEFSGPNGEPFVNGPAGAPTSGGPATPPPSAL